MTHFPIITVRSDPHSDGTWHNELTFDLRQVAAVQYSYIGDVSAIMLAGCGAWITIDMPLADLMRDWLRALAL